MEKIRKDYTKNKIKIVSDMEVIRLCMTRGYASMVFEAVSTELSNKLKAKFGELLRFDTVKGLHKVSEKTLSKIKGNNNDTALKPNQRPDIDER